MNRTDCQLHHKTAVLVSLACILLWSSSASAGKDIVWVEAENATEKLQNSNDWFDPVDRETSLSAHDWWHSFDEPNMESGYAIIPFELPEDGNYTLWMRLNLSSTGYRRLVTGDDPAVADRHSLDIRSEVLQYRPAVADRLDVDHELGIPRVLRHAFEQTAPANMNQQRPARRASSVCAASHGRNIVFEWVMTFVYFPM